MPKNLVITGLSLIILVMILWPSKKQRSNKEDEASDSNAADLNAKTQRMQPTPVRPVNPGTSYICPTPSYGYNPQYPTPNPWYVTPQFPSQQMGGQPFYPQQSQMPNNSDYSQQYYMPGYRFRNPNSDSVQRLNNFNNAETITYPPPTPPSNWENPSYQQPFTPQEAYPQRYTPPQFQGAYPGY